MTETSTPAAIGPAQDPWMPQLVLDLGRPLFHATLLRGLRDAVGADHVTHLRYDGEGRIGYARCASLLDQSMIEWTTDMYVNRLYQRDPNYALVCEAGRQPAPQQQAVRMVAVTPERIHDAEYRRLLFEKPGFASKISLIGACGSSTSYLNLYFSRAVSRRASLMLHRRAALLVALAHRHDELMGAAPAASEPPAFENLSAREREVAELLWQGRTAKEAGRALGLSPTTILTYKARIFEKVQVGSLKEFLRKAPAQQRMN